MKIRKQLIVAAIIAIAAIAGVYWYSDHLKCKRRGEKYQARLDGIRRSVRKLPLGAPKEIVRTFAQENNIDMQFGVTSGQDEARGTIHMTACSPGWYCGDSALIGVVITFNTAGQIQQKDVVTLFDNCL